MFDGIGLVAIIGAALILIVMVIAMRKNKESDIPMERTEEATHELYEEEHEAAKRRDGDT